MDQETAYKALMAFAGPLGIQAWMQRTIGGDWEVTVVAPGQPPRSFATVGPLRTYYRQVRNMQKAPA